MLTWQEENHGMLTIRCMHIQKQKQNKIWNKILMMKMGSKRIRVMVLNATFNNISVYRSGY